MSRTVYWMKGVVRFLYLLATSPTPKPLSFSLHPITPKDFLTFSNETRVFLTKKETKPLDGLNVFLSSASAYTPILTRIFPQPLSNLSLFIDFRITHFKLQRHQSPSFTPKYSCPTIHTVDEDPYHRTPDEITQKS